MWWVVSCALLYPLLPRKSLQYSLYMRQNVTLERAWRGDEENSLRYRVGIWTLQSLVIWLTYLDSWCPYPDQNVLCLWFPPDSSSKSVTFTAGVLGLPIWVKIWRIVYHDVLIRTDEPWRLLSSYSLRARAKRQFPLWICNLFVIGWASCQNIWIL